MIFACPFCGEIIYTVDTTVAILGEHRAKFKCAGCKGIYTYILNIHFVPDLDVEKYESKIMDGVEDA